MTLAEKLVALRGERKLSQGDLAEKLDVSRQSVSKWETGQAVPELDKIIKLADLFGVTVDELVREGDKPQPETCGTETPLAEEPQLKIVYVDRKTFTPIQKFGIVALVIGALMLFGGWLNTYVPVFGVPLVLLSLSLILAKKHPFLIAGWLLCLGSCVVFNPYTSVSAWGLWDGIRKLVILAKADFMTPGYRTYVLGTAIGIVRGLLALVLIVFTTRACWKRWKNRKQDAPEELA